MRNLLSIQGNLVHALAEQERIDSLWVGTDQTLKEDLSQIDKTELSETEEWLMEFSNTKQRMRSAEQLSKTISQPSTR
ncbi:hypothetical protein LINPERPRIM_LOCUS44054, partial [Linum perenne]